MNRHRSNEEPLFKNTALIILGGMLIALFTLIGVLGNPGEIIRQDVRMGPAIAAAKVLVPLFITLGGIVFLASLKKCKSCGKVLMFRHRGGSH